jgi:hypothetical protein
MGPEPEPPQPEPETTTITTTTETEPPPRGECAEQQAAVNHAQASFDRAMKNLWQAESDLRQAEQIQSQAATRYETLRRELQDLGSRLSATEWFYGGENYDRYIAKKTEYKQAESEYWKAVSRTTYVTVSASSWQSILRDSERDLRQARTQLADCMGWPQMPEGWAGTNTPTMPDNTTESPTPDSGSKGVIFGPRRGE